MATRRRRPAPSIAGATGLFQPGSSGIEITGNGFDPFGGSVWIFANQDRTGTADQLSVGTWTDIELSDITVPLSTNNIPGTIWLAVQRRDLAWSRTSAFTLVAAEAESSNVVAAGVSRTKIRYLEYDGALFEYNTPEQQTTLLDLIREVESQKVEQANIEARAEALQRQRKREFEAEQALQREIERVAKAKIDAQRLLKEKEDAMNAELISKLVVEREMIRISLEKPSVRLGKTGIRKLARH